MTVAPKIEGKRSLKEEGQKGQKPDQREIKITYLPLRQTSALRTVVSKQPPERDEKTSVNARESGREEQFAFGPACDSEVFPNDSFGCSEPALGRQADRFEPGLFPNR